MVGEGRTLMVGKRENLLEKIIRYFIVGMLCILLSIGVYGVLFEELSTLYVTLFFICIMGILFYIPMNLLFINDVIYEEGLKIVIGGGDYCIKHFWSFEEIRCIEVGEISERSYEYKILIIHHEKEEEEPVLLTELEYRNKDFIIRVIEECKKRCTRAMWIPMSLERKKEIMEQFGPVIKEKIFSEKLSDGPCSMYERKIDME